MFTAFVAAPLSYWLTARHRANRRRAAVGYTPGHASLLWEGALEIASWTARNGGASGG